MAKDKGRKAKHEVGTKVSTPSWFGSHKSMVDQAATEALNDPGKVVCKDEKGSYITEANRLDTGLADPNRYCDDRYDPTQADIISGEPAATE